MMAGVAKAPQNEEARQSGALDCGHPRRPAGGQEKLVVTELAAIGERDRLLLPVDAGRPVLPEDLDAELPIDGLRLEDELALAVSPAMNPLERAGRSYGRSASAVAIITLPAKPFFLSASAAFKPPAPAPRMRTVRVVLSTWDGEVSAGTFRT